MSDLNRALTSIAEALDAHLVSCLAADQGDARSVKAAHQQIGRCLKRAQEALRRIHKAVVDGGADALAAYGPPTDWQARIQRRG